MRPRLGLAWPRLARLCLALLCLLAQPSRLLAYDASSLAADSAAFLDAEARMHRDLSGAAAALRSSVPLLSPGEGPALSADISLGKLLAPGYAYRQSLPSQGPFASLADSAEAASALEASVGGALALAGGPSLNLNASYLPPMGTGGAESSLLRIGASASWRLLSERFYSLGLLAGGGLSYVRGTETRSIATSFTDASTPAALSGRLDSEWNNALLDLELLVHKTFFVVNFYTRARLSLVLGSSTATLRGITVDGAAVPSSSPEYSSTLTDPALSLVLSGGMELVLGELKLAAEAGRDWLTGALYGSAALRFGM
jgi:hypothetical protein